MSHSVSARRTFRIACPNFNADELEAVRRLLGLLATYLRQPWKLVNGTDEADVVVLSLDGDTQIDYHRHATIVGCSVKPRAHASGTLHRPLRGYELLALLNAEAPGERVAPETIRANDQTEWRYRLRAWPIQANEWPRAWWSVMASIRRAYRGAQELSMRTGVAPAEVQNCIDALNRLELLEREVERRAVPRAEPANTSSWRGLAAKVGQILGFAR